MDNQFKEYRHYPSSREIDAWLDDIHAAARSFPCQAEILEGDGAGEPYGVRHVKNRAYVKFTAEDSGVFYGYWQPALSGPAPLLVHVPGYGAEMSIHPELVALGYNVLHINPLGYCTPQGFDTSRQKDQNWPVLPETVTSGARQGYKIWLRHCVHAVTWTAGQPSVLPGRISFFGSSQGGAGALLLGSLYRDLGVRAVAADVPFLTDFPRVYHTCSSDAYQLAFSPINAQKDPAAGWKAVGYIDTLSHAPRLTMPVMLTAGGADPVCPPASIESLFHRLPGIKSYTLLAGQEHAYTQPFLPLAASWFKLYA